MKKVKIMLMSIAVLAIVGGALAFKAKFDRPICTMDARVFDPTTVNTDLFPDVCPVVTAKTTNIGPDIAWTINPALALSTYTLPGHGAQVFCQPDECVNFTITTTD